MANRFTEFTKLSEWEADMLNDAYEAISVTGNWENMKNFNNYESFMFSSQPWITNVVNAMHYRDSHSGASIGIVMRTMEKIAKDGWESYAAFMKK